MGRPRICSDMGSMGRILGSVESLLWGQGEVAWSDLHHIMIPLWESDYGIWRVGRQVWKQGDL